MMNIKESAALRALQSSNMCAVPRDLYNNVADVLRAFTAYTSEEYEGFRTKVKSYEVASGLNSSVDESTARNYISERIDRNGDWSHDCLSIVMLSGRQRKFFMDFIREHPEDLKYSFKLDQELSAYIDPKGSVLAIKNASDTYLFVTEKDVLASNVLYKILTTVPRTTGYNFSDEYKALLGELFDGDKKKIVEKTLNEYISGEKLLLRLIRDSMRYINFNRTQREIDSKTRSIRDNNSYIESHLSEIAELRRSIEQLQLEIYALQKRAMRGDSIKEEILNFLSTNRNIIQITSCDDRSMYLYVTSYLEYFDEDMFDTFIVDCPADDNPYFVSGIDADVQKAACIRIFSEGKYRIRGCSMFELKDNLYVSAMSGGSYPASMYDNGYVANPHLYNYQCMGNYNLIFSELRSSADPVAILQNIISCGSSINFSDSPVMSRFFRDIFANSYNSKFLESTETGELISMHQLCDEIYAELYPQQTEMENNNGEEASEAQEQETAEE